jgi:hypothetical protein
MSTDDRCEPGLPTILPTRRHEQEPVIATSFFILLTSNLSRMQNGARLAETSAREVAYVLLRLDSCTRYNYDVPNEHNNGRS